MCERGLEVNTGGQHLGWVRLACRPQRARNGPVHHQNLARVEPVPPQVQIGVDQAASFEHDVQ